MAQLVPLTDDDDTAGVEPDILDFENDPEQLSNFFDRIGWVESHMLRLTSTVDFDNTNPK